MGSSVVPTAVHLALAGNQGDVLATFRRVLDQLGECGVRVTAVSPAYRSLAWVSRRGDEPGPDWWNVVCAAETELSARQLLALVHRFEEEAGPAPSGRRADRTLDIDILRYGELAVTEPDLVIPHVGAHQRPFVLHPLADLDSELPLPPTQMTAGAMLAALPDPWAGIEYVMFNWR